MDDSGMAQSYGDVWVVGGKDRIEGYAAGSAGGGDDREEQLLII